MKLSIITINFNNKVGLQRTINSVIAQTFKNFEWIVIDGGSTDGSKELIEQYSNIFSLWLSEYDDGIYNAMNKGIRAATGEYLLMLNSGDYLYNKTVLHDVVPLLDGRDIYVGNEIRGDILWCPKLDEIGDVCELMTVRNIPPQSTFVRKSVFEIYGVYDEDKQIVSDWWLFFNALILGKATIEKLPFIISVFDIYGVSTVQTQLALSEKEDYLDKIPRIRYLAEFHAHNYEIIKSLTNSKLIFFIFRIYYFIYRKLRSQ